MLVRPFYLFLGFTPVRNMVDESTKQQALFESDRKRAIEAMSMAQFIAFAPYVFQASIILRDRNILSLIESNRTEGIGFEAIATQVNMSDYALRILLEAALGIGLVYCKDERYFLAKTGHFFLNDPLTKINTDFMRDLCQFGATDIEASLMDGQPYGLRHFGPWDNLYQGLPAMNEAARTSWFNFNHFHSDNTYPAALQLIFARNPKKILDIGSSAGHFAITALQHDDHVEIGLLDYPSQLDVARKNVAEAGYTNRVKYFDTDMSDPASEIPKGYDVMWMSQFLDSFSEEKAIEVLIKCREALSENGRIFINGNYWDRQRFEVSAFSLQMTSLYFATMVNGKSHIYSYKMLEKFVTNAGLRIINTYDNISKSHSILEVAKQ